MIRFKDYLSDFQRYASVPFSIAVHAVFWCFALLVLPFSAAYYGVLVGWQAAKDEVLK